EARLEHGYYRHMAEPLRPQGDEPLICPVCLYGGKDGYRPESKGVGSVWGAEGFRVLGVTSGEKDLSFQSKGVGSQILGVRSDRITLDDVQDPMQAMQSPADGTALLDWFH